MERIFPPWTALAGGAATGAEIAETTASNARCSVAGAFQINDSTSSERTDARKREFLFLCVSKRHSFEKTTKTKKGIFVYFFKIIIF